jgi:hypothetical protein
MRTSRSILIAWVIVWVTMLPLVHSHMAAGTDASGLDQRSIIHTIFASDLWDGLESDSSAALQSAKYNSPELGFSVIGDKSGLSKLMSVPSADVDLPALFRSGRRPNIAASLWAGRFINGPAASRAPPLSFLL